MWAMMGIMKRSLLLLALVTFLVPPFAHEPSGIGGSVAWAAPEAACTTLGVNCHCSEPLNGPTIAFNAPYWNPGDTTPALGKECNVEGVAGAVFARWDNDITQTNDATIRGALPAGNSVSYVSRAANGHTGIFWVGATLGSNFVKRAAVRMYVYYNPTFQFAYTGGCENHKYFEQESLTTSLGGTDGAGNGGGTHNAYSWGAWNHSPDCCFTGPNSVNYFGVTPASARRGKWWRTEMVLTNRGGGASPNGYRAQIYDKNVTDNGPEELVLDTRGTFFDGLESWGGWTDLTPAARQDFMVFAGYRQGTCAGFYAFSHVLVAGWNTDTGQRIGAASEVEGGGAPNPPAAPFDVRLEAILLMLVGVGAMVCMIMGLNTWLERREAGHGRMDGMGGLGSSEVRNPVSPPQPKSPTAGDRIGRGAVESPDRVAAADEALVGADRNETGRSIAR